MIEQALQAKLLADTTLTTLVGSRIYAGSMPYSFSYPFIRVMGAGENPDYYEVSNRLVETLTVDCFASHNVKAGINGFPTVNSLGLAIYDLFKSYELTRWTDDTYSYDVMRVEYRSSSVRENNNEHDIQKPITLTITYNKNS